MVARSVVCCAAAKAKTDSPPLNSDWHGEFLALLPAIGRYAHGAFGGMLAEARAEAVQEVVALALASYLRLRSRGRTGAAYASTLARFAIARVRE